MRLMSNAICDIHDPLGLSLLTKLRLGLTHLNEHRLNHNFDICLNPLCTSSMENESTKLLSLHCHFYSNIPKTLLDDLNVININISIFSETASTDLLLYGISSFDLIQHKNSLNPTTWKASKNGVLSGSYFPVFWLNTGKYWPEKTPYLDTFHAVSVYQKYSRFWKVY